MRLINTTSLELKEFLGDPTNPRFPRYAILSHTWEEEEVTFQDIQDLDVAKKKAGFSKIARCCEIALDEGLSWAWVDTCCIDKSNNNELSEAINSMFKWYEASTICYAYLSDVGDVGVVKYGDWRYSRWFTRGWTLQELVAPFEVIIYDQEWKQLGTKRRWAKELEERAGIPRDVLLFPAVRREHSVAARMSWAKGRQTTRIEDRAYSLLGLFDIVNMPLVYGEGQQSFSRLHEAIMNTHQDDSIFLGGLTLEDESLSNLPATDPDSPTDSQGFLAMPDNVPHNLVTTLRPLPGASVGIGQRKDPRLRGNILSMNMRVIQVFSKHSRPTPIPITMKKQIELNLDPAKQKALEDLDAHNLKAEGGSLCLGFLRCGPTADRLLARYFMCFLSNDELFAYPTGLYRYVTIREVQYWPSMQCHIFLDVDIRKPFPLLESLRDVAGWELETQPSGTFNNGWSWEKLTPSNSEKGINDPKLGLVRRNTHYYQLSFPPRGQAWTLAISLEANNNISRVRGVGDTDIEVKLQCPTDSELDVQVVNSKHRTRQGPVIELCHRMPVLGGSAELVISVYYGVDAQAHYYSPMIRFRAFEASNTEQEKGRKAVSE
ncbi:heterokaryon incompatibility protein-domain-containing protein [Nemania sp. NC0429]|nr:heterokaryon incompatibility protein-domain-containing protein [Nemania sp. NC0429]